MISDMFCQVLHLFLQIGHYINRVTGSIGTELIELFGEELHIARALEILNGIICRVYEAQGLSKISLENDFDSRVEDLNNFGSKFR